MKQIVLFIVVFVLLIPGVSLAMERFDIVTTEQMRNMLDDRNAGKTDFILVNALDEIIFRDSSIPGSINVPWSKAKELSSRLGKDKDKLIVTY